MVDKIFRFFGRDVGSIHHAAYLLAISTFLSQILGLVRDRLLAGTFGAGETLDIYYAAFRVQDFIFYSIASLISLAVLIPLISKVLEEKGKEEVRKLLNSLFTVTFLLIGITSLLAITFSRPLTELIFPGIAKGENLQTFIDLMRILLLSPFFFSLSGLLASVTQIYNRFYITSLSPLLYNFGIIFGIVYLYPLFGIMGIAYGVLFGAALHMIVQVPYVAKIGLLPKFTFNIIWQDIKVVVGLSFYRGLALGLNQLALIFLVGLASTLSVGSIAVMTFAQNMQNIPFLIIGASYSIAAFPVLAKFYSKGDLNDFILQLKDTARHIVFWTVPAIVIFIVFRAQIVRVILGSGNFTWSDTRLTAACLALFVISVVAQSLSILFMRAYYAAGRNKENLVVAFFSSIVTLLAAYGGLHLFKSNAYFATFLEHLLRLEGVSGTEVLMLPLAFTLGAFVNVSLFVYLARRDFNIKNMEIGGTFLHSFAASVAMGYVAYQFLNYFGTIFDINTFVGIFFQGLLSALFGILAWIFILSMLKNREYLETIKALRKRFTKEEIVGAQEV